MSRFRLYPTPRQAELLLQNCGQARFVWNLAIEQLGFRAHGQRVPSPSEQFRQLTDARRAFDWLAKGSVIVQQQALRDFHEAVSNWRARTHGRPTWRKRGKREGFRVVDGHGIKVEQLNRTWSRAWIPKVGWVRFRRSRPFANARSFRVNLDPAGRWHISFAIKPRAIDGPGNGSVVGIDRGVTVTLALSNGALIHAPVAISVRKAAQAMSRCAQGSNRRKKATRALARIHARNTDRRKNFIETVTTHLAKSYDTIRIENLRVPNMVRSARGTIDHYGRNVRQKSVLNMSILASGWGMFAQRLVDKAHDRVEKVNPAYTSQRCSVCGHVDANSRKSQALFKCTACGYTSNADLNAARNIAAGRAVRRAEQSAALKREPQLCEHEMRIVEIRRLKPPGGRQPDCYCQPPLWFEWDDTPVPCQADCGRWIEPGQPCARHDGKRVCYDCARSIEVAQP